MKILFFIAILAVSAFPQVQVSQSFLDDANAAFKEVVVLRKANDALTKAIDLNEVAIKALTFSNDQLKEQNNDLRKLKCDTTSFFFGLIKNKRCK